MQVSLAVAPPPSQRLLLPLSILFPAAEAQSIQLDCSETTHRSLGRVLMPNLSGSNIFSPVLGAETRHNCRFVQFQERERGRETESEREREGEAHTWEWECERESERAKGQLQTKIAQFKQPIYVCMYVSVCMCLCVLPGIFLPTTVWVKSKNHNKITRLS